MTYSGLTIETTVHDTTMSSHAIPAYPEYTSSTDFNAAFYAERRAENDRLIGAAVDYIDDPNQGPGVGGGLADWTDAAVSGPSSLTVGSNQTYTLTGTYSSEYVNGYQILWTVPPGEATIWDYASDATDILTVTVNPKSAGSGTVRCTLSERGNPSNSKTVTQAITVS